MLMLHIRKHSEGDAAVYCRLHGQVLDPRTTLQIQLPSHCGGVIGNDDMRFTCEA